MAGSECVDHGHGCEAGNPQIGALSESELARLPSDLLAACRRHRVQPSQIRRCVYCGALFIDAYDLQAQKARKIRLGYYNDATGEVASVLASGKP